MEPLFEVAVFLLCVAVGGAGMLGTITEALEEGAFTGNHAVDAAAAVLLRLALPVAYFAGVILVYHRVITPRRPL
ncbi:hypothetical protein E2562_029888 [Oryza meyeriana var. granulata]|uniref:Uncharacterized protein n=1 Tax=Oryza meyeriana var. granulata TaxID=110450 RepID=A0A6G1CUG0_9ORYZ|nr:hypothetical protein E2562_029888 [Oryza meyeriana var. granulata]